MKEVTMETDNNEPVVDAQLERALQQVVDSQLERALQQVVDSTDANELSLAKTKLSIVLDALGS